MVPAAPHVALRAVVAGDGPFLLRLYASTRTDEVAAWGWPEAQREAFLRQQFEAQSQSYRLQFPGARWTVVLDGDTPVGRMVVDYGPGEIRLVDVALLPEHRGRGLGSGLIRELQAEAQRSGRPLRLHAAVSNRAGSLYERLGFVAVGVAGIHREMVWAPSGDEAVRPGGAIPAEGLPPDGRAAFESFRGVVLADAPLQGSLREGPADPDGFAALAVRLGAERGFAFTPEDVLEAMREARRAWLERWVR